MPDSKPIIKNIALALCSTLISLLCVIGGMKLYVHMKNIQDPSFRYENQLDMRDPDPTTGYVNKKNFTGYCWGNVLVQTDRQGFRDVVFTSIGDKKARRIIGMGDSVMWGSGVNKEDSFLDMLGRKLKKTSEDEVVNAGVVGYASYQELLYLKKDILPLKPDIILINFCENDLLPEDPFENLRAIYLSYLHRLLHDERFTPWEKDRMKELMRIFQSKSPVVNALIEWQARDRQRRAFLNRIFIEMPVAAMAGLSRKAHTRFIYIFIPPQAPNSDYLQLVERLKTILTNCGAEYVDVRSEFTEAYGPEQDQSWHGFALDWLWPSELKQIIMLRNIQSAHQERLYIDGVHPSIKGNRIIADSLYLYLAKHPR